MPLPSPGGEGEGLKLPWSATQRRGILDFDALDAVLGFTQIHHQQITLARRRGFVIHKGKASLFLCGGKRGPAVLIDHTSQALPVIDLVYFWYATVRSCKPRYSV